LSFSSKGISEKALFQTRLPPEPSLSFDPAVFNKSYASFLFDMDGTILNSLAAAERVWGALANAPRS
jgi:hypothetical protein